MPKKLITIFLSLIIVGLPLTAWWQREQLFETIRLHNYQPPANVSKLADTTTMTDSSRRLFYAYKPSLENKATFFESCGNQEQTIVLGCYIQHKGIFLYDVTDSRLNGVVEVTAAHELLHAQYDRLSSSEKRRIDGLTAQTLKGITDERLLSMVNNYRNSDPSVVPNELHSILATEVSTLPVELEQYYKRYFHDRQAVVNLAHTYTGEFTRREKRVKELDTQLAQTKPKIDKLDASLSRNESALNSQYNTMQRLKQAGRIDEYNSMVDSYNTSAQSYNRDINSQRDLVNKYNAMVEERNSLAVEENQLIKALDSRPTVNTQ